MSDKGGKGFSVPKSGKSALRTNSASKGKDIESNKTRMKVQFSDSDDSFDEIIPKANGKSGTTNGKGDWDKGLKTGKTHKAPTAKQQPPQPPLELRVEQELSKNTTCLMDCEAAEILLGVQDYMTVLSADPAIKIPVSFDRGLTYANRGSHYSNPQKVRQILEPLKKLGVTDGEICMIANVYQDTIEEVFALVPSLNSEKGALREALRNALEDLAKLKTTSGSGSEDKC